MLSSGWLAFVAAAALGAQLLFGTWWVDAIASLAIVQSSFEKVERRGKEYRDHD